MQISHAVDDLLQIFLGVAVRRLNSKIGNCDFTGCLCAEEFGCPKAVHRRILKHGQQVPTMLAKCLASSDDSLVLGSLTWVQAQPKMSANAGLLSADRPHYLALPNRKKARGRRHGRSLSRTRRAIETR